MTKKIIVTALLVCLMTLVHAQENQPDRPPQYVTDQLRLSLYQQADAQSQVLELLRSGDSLKIEEIAGPYARVITPSGKTGWVKRGFLVSNRTSNLLLADMTQKNELLQKELEKLNDSKVVLDQYETDMDNMSGQIETLKEQKQLAEETIAELEQQAQLKLEQEKARPALAAMIKVGRAYWHYLLLILVGITLIGFLMGKKITETNIKRKFHGIKVW